jgi:hypothetical protein
VRDGVLLRLIGKWLNAGVLEDGCVTHPERGGIPKRIMRQLPQPVLRIQVATPVV